MPDGGVLGMFYDKLAETEVTNLEEARKKMSFLYRKNDQSMIDKLRAAQIQYNTIMNKI